MRTKSTGNSVQGCKVLMWVRKMKSVSVSLVQVAFGLLGCPSTYTGVSTTEACRWVWYDGETLCCHLILCLCLLELLGWNQMFGKNVHARRNVLNPMISALQDISQKQWAGMSPFASHILVVGDFSLSGYKCTNWNSQTPSWSPLISKVFVRILDRIALLVS